MCEFNYACFTSYADSNLSLHAKKGLIVIDLKDDFDQIDIFYLNNFTQILV